MQDPITVVATLFLYRREDWPGKIGNWVSCAQEESLKLTCKGISLAGEWDEHTLLLHGSAQPDLKPLWLEQLHILVSPKCIEQYQVDLFEEDGRLLQRLQGGG